MGRTSEQQREYNRMYYQMHKAELDKRHAQWYLDNKEKAVEYQKAYNKAHRVKKAPPTPEEIVEKKRISHEKRLAYYRECNNRPEMKEYRHQRYLAQKARATNDTE